MSSKDAFPLGGGGEPVRKRGICHCGDQGMSIQEQLIFPFHHMPLCTKHI